MPHFDHWWERYGYLLMHPETPVLAAMIVLIGVLVTGAVTIGLGAAARRSAERIATERVEHDKRQGALDRLHNKRGETFLAALNLLSDRRAISQHPSYHPAWQSPWEGLFSPELKEKTQNELKVYVDTQASELFGSAWDAYREACYEHASGHQGMLLLQGDMDPFSQMDAARGVKRSDYDADDQEALGAGYLADLESWCQGLLADEQVDLPTRVLGQSWFAMLEARDGHWARGPFNYLTRTETGWTDEPARDALAADLGQRPSESESAS